jgi:hypothetical protein
MRTISTLVGLTLFALTATARAEEATPASATAAPPAGDAAAPVPAPAADVAVPAPAAEPAPVATTAAPAEPSTPPPAAEPAAASRRKLQVGLAFLPMGLGRYTQSPNTATTVSSDALFAYGFGLSVGYEVMPGLVVGIAPQMIYNVGEKEPENSETKPQKQTDYMLRVAYSLRITDNSAVYAELLPGYSMIGSDLIKGPVVAFGVGAEIDVTDRAFVNLGMGYQIGFQSWKRASNTYETRTKYVRVALGGGVRF